MNSPRAKPGDQSGGPQRLDPVVPQYAVQRVGVTGFLDAWHALGGTSAVVAHLGTINETDATTETELVWATAAVAQTGSVVVDSVRNPRAASLLSERCVFVIDADTIVETPREILGNRTRWWPGRLPSQIVFVSGPSRSADIEMTLTVGIHGPGQVHAIIVDPLG